MTKADESYWALYQKLVLGLNGNLIGVVVTSSKLSIMKKMFG